LDKYYALVIPALIMGTIARVHMMKSDYRQYPTYPKGYLAHFTLGFIAAGLGAIALPAFIEKEYAAITFLAIAAQHFRDIRSMERQSLDNIEVTEIVPRGTAYIEDIAKTFEARNYMAIITALVTSVIVHITLLLKVNQFIAIIFGVLGGLFTYIFIKNLIRGQQVGDVAEVKEAKISFDGPMLKVNDIIIMNIGLEESRDVYLKNGVAVEIIPNDENALVYLSNIGQRQAIEHNAANQLCIRKDVDEPDFTPTSRRNAENGNLVMIITLMNPNTEALIEVVKNTPVLESSKRKPLDAAVALKLKTKDN